MDQARITTKPILTPKSTCGDLMTLPGAQLLRAGRELIKHEQNYQLATEIYLKVADEGNDTDNSSSTASKSIELLLQNPEYQLQIFMLCVDASDNGSRSAAHIISLCYEIGARAGYPVDRDVSQQIIYLKRAADLDHPEALLQLSQYYEAGIGVEQDLLEAAMCVERLSHLYEHGTGVKQSTVIANSYAREVTSLREQAHMAQLCGSDLTT